MIFFRSDLAIITINKSPVMTGYASIFIGDIKIEWSFNVDWNLIGYCKEKCASQDINFLFFITSYGHSEIITCIFDDCLQPIRHIEEDREKRQAGSFNFVVRKNIREHGC